MNNLFFRVAALSCLVGCASTQRPAMPQTLHAEGAFDVKLSPQPTAAGLGRFLLDKTFHGTLEAESHGEMLSAGDPRSGNGGYVAMEHVTGTLQGRRGAFALQHTGTLRGGAQTLTITVVPGSGTDELAGLSGQLSIDIREGKHFYRFDYTLAPR